MKKHLLILILLFIGYSLQSQVLISLLFGDKLNSDGLEFGLEGGFNHSTITGLESNNSLSEFYLGFYFDIRLKDQWSLDTGFMVKSTLGNDDLTENDLNFLHAEIHEEEGRYEQKMSYWLLPVLVKYKFKNYIYVEAGTQFGLMRKGWVEFNSNIDDKNIRIKETNTDMINRFDMGIVAGTGFTLLKGIGWTIGAKYYYGFLDVYKERSGTKNSSLFLKMNIPIGLSEKSKEEIQEFKAQNKEKKKIKKEERKKNKENKI